MPTLLEREILGAIADARTSGDVLSVNDVARRLHRLKLDPRLTRSEIAGLIAAECVRAHIPVLLDRSA